jgi:hypothetical protein
VKVGPTSDRPGSRNTTSAPTGRDRCSAATPRLLATRSTSNSHSEELVVLPRRPRRVSLGAIAASSKRWQCLPGEVLEPERASNARVLLSLLKAKASDCPCIVIPTPISIKNPSVAPRDESGPPTRNRADTALSREMCVPMLAAETNRGRLRLSNGAPSEWKERGGIAAALRPMEERASADRPPADAWFSSGATVSRCCEHAPPGWGSSRVRADPRPGVGPFPAGKVGAWM